MIVEYSPEFLKRFKHFSNIDKLKINDFVDHIEQNGFVGLPGRNKNSDFVDKNNHNFIQIVKYAQQHKLWHYHIGIPTYDMTNPKGDWTSEWILHYQILNNNEIFIVELDFHPPFTLPKQSLLRDIVEMFNLFNNSNAETNNFSFDIERMDKILKGPFYRMPEGLSDEERIEWLNTVRHKQN